MLRRLNKEEIKFLNQVKKSNIFTTSNKFITKSGCIMLDCINKKYNLDFTKIDLELINNLNYVDTEFKNNTYYLKLTPSGNSFLDSINDKNFKFWFPTIVSIVALIISLFGIIF